MSLERILNLTKKIVINSLVITTFTMFFTEITQAKEKEKKGFVFNVGLGYDLFRYKTADFPFAIRDIPIHKDDEWKVIEENKGPIDLKDVNLKNGIPTFVARLGGSYLPNDHIRLMGGVGINVSCGNSYDKRRNYTNHPGTEIRGYGAALTYLKLSSDKLKPVAFSELEFKIKRFGLGLGMEIYYMKTTAERGWDRYDRLELFDEIHLHKITFGRPYISLKFLTPYKGRTSNYDTTLMLNIGSTFPIRERINHLIEDKGKYPNTFVEIRYGVSTRR